MRVSSLRVELYLGLVLLVLRSSDEAARGESLPSLPSPPTSSEESSARREVRDVEEVFLGGDVRGGGTSG